MKGKEKNHTELIVPGFLASGISSGIKKRRNAKDLALLYSEKPAVAAAVFTQNRMKAAPVLVSMERITRRLCQAIIVNSGNANACTGKAGLKDAYSMAQLVAQSLRIDEDMVLVASTGVIGRRLPMEVISQNIPRLVEGLALDGFGSMAEAILTTDTFPKTVLRKERIGGEEITLCGIAKGAGMIMPNMATMLSFILTDANIEAEVLQEVFKESVECSFNSITVDGEMSTNDVAIILANGRAENPKIMTRCEDLKRFKSLLMEALMSLAHMIVQDGEGATKCVEIRVLNAKGYNDARKVAFSVANSNLVKTAFFGEDCNWGRIISAIGAAGVDIVPEKIDISFEDIRVITNGVSGGADQEKRARNVLKKKEFWVEIDLNCGSSNARVLTTDLSPEYININAHYTT